MWRRKRAIFVRESFGFMWTTKKKIRENINLVFVEFFKNLILLVVDVIVFSIKNLFILFSLKNIFIILKESLLSSVYSTGNSCFVLFFAIVYEHWVIKKMTVKWLHFLIKQVLYLCSSLKSCHKIIYRDSYPHTINAKT